MKKKYAIWDPQKSNAILLKLTSKGDLQTVGEIDGHVRYLNWQSVPNWWRYQDKCVLPHSFPHECPGQTIMTDRTSGSLKFLSWQNDPDDRQTISFSNKKMTFKMNDGRTFNVDTVFPVMYHDHPSGYGHTEPWSRDIDYCELTTKDSRLTITKIF